MRCLRSKSVLRLSSSEKLGGKLFPAGGFLFARNRINNTLQVKNNLATSDCPNASQRKPERPLRNGSASDRFER